MIEKLNTNFQKKDSFTYLAITSGNFLNNGPIRKIQSSADSADSPLSQERKIGYVAFILHERCTNETTVRAI